MLFIHPMWDSETQRIGKQKCTPPGYAIHVIADLLGFAGFVLLFLSIFYSVYKGFTGTYRGSLLWFIAVPFGVGIVSEALFRFSWFLARRRGFKYDHATGVASWNENGQRVKYRWETQRQV